MAGSGKTQQISLWLNCGKDADIIFLLKIRFFFRTFIQKKTLIRMIGWENPCQESWSCVPGVHQGCVTRRLIHQVGSNRSEGRVWTKSKSNEMQENGTWFDSPLEPGLWWCLQASIWWLSQPADEKWSHLVGLLPARWESGAMPARQVELRPVSNPRA